MFLAHGPVSYLANEIIQKKKISNLKFHEQLLVGILAFLFGILPDIDLLILPMFSLPAFSHHNYFSHTPFTYIILWIALKISLLVLRKVFNKKATAVLHKDLLDIILNTFLIATMMHFIADILVGSIMFIYPISTFKLSFFSLFLHPNLFLSYFLLPDFAIEIVICAVFFNYIYNKFFKKNLVLDIFKYFLLVFSIAFFSITLFFNLQTYNNNVLYDSNGKENYDTDYDGLYDRKDMDVDNDGADNLVDIDIQKLTKEVRGILESGKLASTNEKSLPYMLGAFDSYRVISQAYFNLHSPIEAVLRNSWGQAYSEKLDYKELFFTYFQSKDMLEELNTEEQRTLNKGSLLFLIDNEKRALNYGLVLDDGGIGIVLDSDKKLQTHSMEEVLKQNYAKILVTK